MPPGRIPRNKECILFGDLIDCVKPGDSVDIVGVFSTRYQFDLNVKSGFPIFHTLIEVNSINLIDKPKNASEYD